MPLVALTPVVLKIDHRDLTNRVCCGEVCVFSITFFLHREAVSQAGSNSRYFENNSVRRRRATLAVESLGSSLTK